MNPRLSRRSITEWAVRSIMALIVAGLTGTVIAQSTGYTLRNRNIDLAQALAPGDGRVTALKAEDMLQGGMDKGRVERLARQALRQDPTAVAAASTLGLGLQMQGKLAAASRMMDYAEYLSRRDLQSRVWAIETAISHGDVPSALRHYDIALRTSRQAPDLLFPVLATAISDPTIRTALVRTLAARPPWSREFLDQIAGSAPDQRSTAQLYIALAHVGIPVSPGARAAVIDALIAGGDPDAAWAYYATIRQGVSRERSRDPRFAALLDTPTPFDWVAINDVGVTSSIQSNGKNGLFDFAVSSGIGGPLLRQRQLLPRGHYHVEGHGIGIDQPANAAPYLTLQCSNGEENGRIEIPNSSNAKGFFSGSLTVPANCPIQTLTLVARSSDKIGGAVGQIDFLRLLRKA